ncbi:MAG: carbohydrate kinase [Candidatus Nanopelagicales bacterium]|nr:carbohydrate kinase [Candidatus Nanopelagicales bacterium]
MITVMGENLIDIIVSPAGEVASVVGGAPLNTARTLARLGHQVTFLGGVSHDSFGKRIKRQLDADGVGYALGELTAQSTTLAIAELDDGGAATYRFMFEGTAAASMTPEVAVAALDRDTTVLHVGTLALVFNPLAHATQAVVQAVSTDCTVMVDPNCRPSVMTDSTLFNETLKIALDRADLVKVSGDDLEFLWPEIPAIDAAKNLQRESGAVVLFTDGAQAVRVITGNGEVVLEVPKVSVVDTVGAGDSFSGGFLAAWLDAGRTRADLQNIDAIVEAAKFGIRVAGLTCQRAGAEPPFPADLEIG